jgi:CRISPR-associated protein Cmr5
MSTRQSTEQKRARRAIECVEAVKKANENNKNSWAKEYGSLARSAAADIQSNGLGQTLAFWYSKGWEGSKPKGDQFTYLYNHISGWVGEQMGWQGKDLLTQLTKEATTAQYRRATAEAQTFLVWLKRFAEAELGEGGG